MGVGEEFGVRFVGKNLEFSVRGRFLVGRFRVSGAGVIGRVRFSVFFCFLNIRSGFSIKERLVLFVFRI